MSQAAKRVVIYARVSTNDQDTERQVRDLTEYAQRCGYLLLDTFIETASGGNNDRKVRAKIIQIARERKIDGVLVTEMSRWGRDLSDLIRTLKLLQSYKVSLITQSGMSFELETAQGEMMVTCIGMFAAFEKAILRERTKSGLETARAKGKKLGRPIGHPIDQKHSTKVLGYLAEGKTIRWIADELHISPTTVQAIKKRA